jgi:hypothetical protein
MNNSNNNLNLETVDANNNNPNHNKAIDLRFKQLLKRIIVGIGIRGCIRPKFCTFLINKFGLREI